jgi:hypothetical protein
MKEQERVKQKMNWDDIKRHGSDHYKSGGKEPIDLYKSAGALRHFALCSIIKYAYRNLGVAGKPDEPVKNKDMEKIIHYAKMVMVALGE